MRYIILNKLKKENTGLWLQPGLRREHMAQVFYVFWITRKIRRFLGETRMKNASGVIKYRYDAGGKLIEQNDEGVNGLYQYT